MRYARLASLVVAAAVTPHTLAADAPAAAASLDAASAEVEAAPAKQLTMADVLAASKPQDWRRPDPEHTLYLELAAGRVVIELAPDFAPLHAENILKLVAEKYFDGLALVRSHDNFVVQWGDPDAGDEAKSRKMKHASKTVAPEFTRAADGVAFTRLPDRDGYAPETGFAAGFPAARDAAKNEAWLAHCYGMVGAGRGNEIDSGSGAELYVVTGHAPRQLDRNIALVGRVIQGIERLSVLPRGTGPLGFYEKAEQYTPIKAIRLAADVPPAERTAIELLRTDTPTFARLVEARRNRRDDWYKVPAGHIDVCNVPLPARPVAAGQP